MNYTIKRKKSWGGRIVLILLAFVFFAALLTGMWFAIGGGREYIMKRAYPLEYEETVLEESKEAGLDPALVFAVIKTESNFDCEAESHAGARGLMQMMPETFVWLQSKRGESGAFTEEDLYTPAVNIRYGCYYLAWLCQRYEILETALAAYNAGPGNVDRWLADSETSVDGKNLSSIPIGETRRYVESVAGNYQVYKELYQIS